jgi:hypothetical protein
MATPLPPDVKKRVEKKIADRPKLKIQDPGTMWTNPDGKVFVFVVDEATASPLWIEL